MKDAFGGILNLLFLAVFLLLVSGILGLIVNYTKAFKMKNIVIDTIERYEGACKSDTSPCMDTIKSKARDISYSPTMKSCQDGTYRLMGAADGGAGYFCMKAESMEDYNQEAFLTGTPCIFTVTTQSDISLPILSHILNFNIFRVTGNTEIIVIPEEGGGCFITG